MDNDKIREILQKQLELLSKRSEEENIDISGLTHAMIAVINQLLVI